MARVLAAGLALVGTAQATFFGGSFQDDQCTMGFETCVPSIECFQGAKYTCANNEVTFAQYSTLDCSGEPAQQQTYPATGNCDPVMFNGLAAGYAKWDCNSDCTININVQVSADSSAGLPEDLVTVGDGANNIITFEVGFENAQCTGDPQIFGVLIPSGCSCSASDNMCIQATCTSTSVSIQVFEDSQVCGGFGQVLSGNTGQCVDVGASGGLPGIFYGVMTCGSANGAVDVEVEVLFDITVDGGAPAQATLDALGAEITASIAAELGIPPGDIVVTFTVTRRRRMLLQTTTVQAKVVIKTEAATPTVATTITDELKTPEFATAVETTVASSNTVNATVSGNVNVGDAKETPKGAPNSSGAAELGFMAVFGAVLAAMA